MTRRFAVVYEAEADFVTATELADRVLVDSVGWLTDDDLVYQRTWLPEMPAGRPLSWKALSAAGEVGTRARGHFDEEPARPDAKAARRAILYLRLLAPDLDGILLIRDQDHQPERRAGLEQARRAHAGPVPVVVGFAVREREAWVLCGFDHRDDEEAEKLAGVRQRYGRNPQTGSHAFTDPKTALRELTGGDADRERRCWLETPLDMLRRCGTDNGLADYLSEVEAQLAPLFGRAS